MRREGFEFQVGRPRVLFKQDSNGNKMEPVEQAVVECPDGYSGKVVEVFGNAGGIMTNMDTSGTVTHLEFKIPTLSLIHSCDRVTAVARMESATEKAEASGEAEEKPEEASGDDGAAGEPAGDLIDE